jgi:chemotaxis signal transduction protein
VSGEHLLVRLGETVAALPARGVRRVLRAVKVHPMPGAGEGVLGLAEFAGEPLVVLELARLVGVETPAGPPPAVTVVAWIGPDADREIVGLAVDEALEVAALDGAAIAGGEALVGGVPVRLIDLERIGEAA